jgi:hypothetical protein
MARFVGIRPLSHIRVCGTRCVGQFAAPLPYEGTLHTMPRSITFAEASPGDAEGIAALQTAVARDLTARYGRGHWSHETTVKACGSA